MARRPRGEEERSMDSLMDALTNVVGILLLILIVLSLQITTEVRKVVESLPEVTEEELEAMKTSRDKTLENLENLKQTHNNTLENLPTEEEATQLVAELEEFEENNEELAEKTSDIEEWAAKVTEQEQKQETNEGLVSVADTKNRELAAILAQTPEVEVKQAKEVLMPDPRRADPEATALYILCKFGKIYFVGDPYIHALGIRDVIDQNFTDLAFTGKAIGDYTYALKDTRKNENDAFIPITETYRLSRREREALGAWDSMKAKWGNREGVIEDEERSIVDRIFGSNDEAELNVGKFRYDMKKISAYFGEGKFGPKDFKYHVVQGGGDRVKMQLEPREDGGWTPEEFTAAGSAFEQACKQASTARRTLFYYHVAPDSFETYLQARSTSEKFRIPAGWTVWEGEKFEPKAMPQRPTLRYNLDTIPDEAYMQVANVVGPHMFEELSAEWDELDERVAAAVPEEMTDEAEKAAFTTKLKTERAEFDGTRFTWYTLNIFKTALAAEEASGETEVVIEIHPPEIPHIRLFAPARPPSAPTPPPTDTPKPEPPKPPTGPPTLILD